jgi:hypothetical protein
MEKKVTESLIDSEIQKMEKEVPTLVVIPPKPEAAAEELPKDIVFEDSD